MKKGGMGKLALKDKKVLHSVKLELSRHFLKFSSSILPQ
jgi:hypothetical protein